MNIFFLDENPQKAAQSLCDKHVVKMVLETAQMCSTAARPPVNATTSRTQPVRALRMMCSAHGATRPV